MHYEIFKNYTLINNWLYKRYGYLPADTEISLIGNLNANIWWFDAKIVYLCGEKCSPSARNNVYEYNKN